MSNYRNYKLAISNLLQLLLCALLWLSLKFLISFPVTSWSQKNEFAGMKRRREAQITLIQVQNFPVVLLTQGHENRS